MPETKIQMFSLLHKVLTALSLGLLSWGLMAVIELGKVQSADHRDLQFQHDRIEKLESQGSSQVRTHIAEDNSDKAAMNKRIDEMRLDYGQRISNITSLLEKLIEQQTQLIAYLKAKELKSP